MSAMQVIAAVVALYVMLAMALIFLQAFGHRRKRVMSTITPPKDGTGMIERILLEDGAVALKPCPFCGEYPYVHVGDTAYVRCVCGTAGPSCDTANDAADRWNRRR